MPTVRYEIRNEYGLADPELYRAADKDDPEALLEGVAMSGLVGLLRQLGDLAEFAAEIFHDLHEEVTVTAARGHGLMLRVQQLEAEFPSIEKAFLSQTSHSHFAYNEGIDWHANIRMDQNLVTQGDMPRFILDSYEESRGPPRLFMLDKFDVAGAGACLKRYSDPSFFKVDTVDLASSDMMDDEVRREKKARRIKKKGSRWRNSGSTESFFAPLVNSNLQPDQVTEKVPSRRVKLKSRNLIGLDTTSRRSYMEHLLEVNSPEQKVMLRNSTSQSCTQINSIDSSDSALEVHEIVIDPPTDPTIVIDRNLMQSPNKHETMSLPTNHGLAEAVKSPPALLEVEQKKIMDDTSFTTDDDLDSYRSDDMNKTKLLADCFRPDEADSSPQALLDKNNSLADAKFMKEGSFDDYRSEDIGSDQENYMDALNSMESEIETDSGTRAKSDPGLFHMGSHGKEPDCNERLEFSVQFSEPNSVENTSASRELSYLPKNDASSPNSDTPGILSDRGPQKNSSFDVPANQEICLDKSHNKTPEKRQRYSAVGELTNSVLSLPNGMGNAKMSDVSFKPGIGETSSSSCASDSTPSPIHLSPPGIVAVQSDSPQPVESLSGYVERTTEVTQLLVGNQENFSELADNTDSSDKLLCLSDIGYSSIGKMDIPEEPHPVELAREQNYEIMSDRSGLPDHVSQTQVVSILEELPPGHVEGLQLTVRKASHIQGGQHALTVQEKETSSSGSASPTIRASSPEASPIASQRDDFAAVMENVRHPNGLASVVSYENEKNTCEVIGHLDGKLPCAAETFSFRSESYGGMSFPESDKDANFSCDFLLPVCDISEKTCTAEYAEPNFEERSNTQDRRIPEDFSAGYVLDSLASFTGRVEDSQDVSDALLVVSDIPEKPSSAVYAERKFEEVSNTQDIIIPEDVEDSLASLIVHVGDSQEPVEQYTQSCSGEGMSRINSVLSPGISHISVQSDGLAAGMDKVAATGEDCSVDERGESKILMPKPESYVLEHFSDAKDLQEHRDVDLDEILPLCFEKKEFCDDLHVKSNTGPDDIGETKILMPNAHPLELENLSDVEQQQTTHDVKSGELLPLCPEREGFTAGIDQQTEIPDSFVVVGPEAVVADDMRLPCLSKLAPDYHNDLLSTGKLTQYDEPLAEYVMVEADADRSGLCSISTTPEVAGFDAQLQEDYVSRDAIFGEQILEINNVASPKDIIVLHQNEDQVVSLRADSISNFYIQDSSYSCDSKSSGRSDHMLPSESDIDKESSAYSLECEHSGSKEDIFTSAGFHVEPAIPLEEASISQASSEPDVILSHLEGEHLEASDHQHGSSFPDEQHNNQNKSKVADDKASEPEPCVIVTNVENDESGINEQLDREASVSAECISEISVASLAPIISASGLPLIASSHSVTSETSHQESSETQGNEPSSSFQLQDAEESPPLPPLPPLEWTMGKLQLGSLAPGGDTVRPLTGTNPFMEPPTTDKHPHGSVQTGNGIFQSPHLFEPLLELEEEKSLHASLASEKKHVQPLRLSELPPIVDDTRHQHGSLILDGKLLNLTPSTLEGEITQHPQLLQGEQLQTIQDQRIQLGQLLTSLELERSQHQAQTMGRDIISPLNPFLAVSSTEWNHQYVYGVYEGQNVQHLNLSPPLPVTGQNIPPYGFVYSMGENPSTIYDFMVPGMEGEKPNWKHRSIRDRPRNPLIEAVAAHDKSKLRKVTELDRQSARPKTDERDSLLEQIRNKSFNLKPAASARPNVKGPSTNLKVAAILEKANAIRQACVGSDEDEDNGDSWSDS